MEFTIDRKAFLTALDQAAKAQSPLQEILKMMRQGMKLEILPGMRIQGVRMMSLVARIPDPEPGVVRRFLWM